MGFGPAAMEVVLEHETALLEAWHSREG
jgi:hypothetical protein